MNSANTSSAPADHPWSTQPRAAHSIKAASCCTQHQGSLELGEVLEHAGDLPLESLLLRHARGHLTLQLGVLQLESCKESLLSFGIGGN